MERKLSAYDEQNERHDVILQLAIRQVDSKTFIACMKGLTEEDRAVLYRNLSARACKAVEEDLAADGPSIGEGASRAAVREFMRLVNRYARQEASADAHTGGYTPRPASLSALAGNFVELSRMRSDERYDEIRELGKAETDPFLRLGLSMVADGVEALEARARLTSLREALLADRKRELDLALDGFDALLSGDRPGRIAEKLLPLTGRA